MYFLTQKDFARPDREKINLASALIPVNNDTASPPRIPFNHKEW